MKTILKTLNNFVKLFSRKKTPVNNNKISKKNKWLYPEDSFGKMEHGVEYDKK
jgi:hypothetical protein